MEKLLLITVNLLFEAVTLHTTYICTTVHPRLELLEVARCGPAPHSGRALLSLCVYAN